MSEKAIEDTEDVSHRALALFDQASALASNERTAFLDRSCVGDGHLRKVVQFMLDAELREDLEGFLEVPLTRPDKSTLAQFDLDSTVRVERIGPYEVLAKIGEGGMSEVFLARHTDSSESGREVAIKLIRPDRPGFELRFEREQSSLESLQAHPAIVQLHDTGVAADGRPYFVMEVVNGSPMTDYCDTEALTVEERLDLFLRVCNAVDHAHRNLVVHRDLKPANILVDRRGHPRLLDFGIAKLLDEEQGMTAADVASSAPALTPSYAAPELMLGGAVTTATDVYSLGVVLYELLTGERPFGMVGRTPVEILENLKWREARLPSQVVAEGNDRSPSVLGSRTKAALAKRLDGDLDVIALRALRFETHLRYGSVAELAADLRRHLDGVPIEARPASLGYRVGKVLRRHALATVAGFLVVTFSIVAFIGIVLHSRQLSRERDLALEERQRSDRFSSFLVSLFREIDPEVQKGPTLSVRELLETGATTVERELDDDPELQARLLEVLGSGLSRVDSFDRSEPLLQRALALREQTLPAAHSDLAISLEALGSGHLDKRELDLARPYLERAFEIRKRALGDEHPLVATSMIKLAELAVQSGEEQEAKSLFEAALHVLRTDPDDHHEQQAAALGGLGDIFVRERDLEAARTAFGEAVGLLEETPERTRLARALTGQAQVHFFLGEAAPARELALRSLAIREAVYGPDHPLLGLSLELLAAVAWHNGEDDEAIAQLLRILDIERPVYGDESPNHVQIYKNLANLHLGKEELESAERYARKALTIFETHSPADLLQLSGYVTMLASVQYDQGKTTEALAGFERALAISESVLESEPPTARSRTDVAWTLVDIAAVHHRAGDVAKALPMFAQAAELMDQVIGDTEVPHQLEVAIRALIPLGRLDQAQLLLDRFGGVGQAETHRELSRLVDERVGRVD